MALLNNVDKMMVNKYVFTTTDL